MRFAIWIAVMLGTVALLGCTAVPPDRPPPRTESYGEWGARLGEIPEIIKAAEYCEAGLGRYRNAMKTTEHDKIVEELTMSIKLYVASADQLYAAWHKYPEYENFIVMEIDKVYGYLHDSIAKRPYFFKPPSEGEAYTGEPLTYAQKQAMQQYQRALKRWLKSLPVP